MLVQITHGKSPFGGWMLFHFLAVFLIFLVHLWVVAMHCHQGDVPDTKLQVVWPGAFGASILQKPSKTSPPCGKKNMDSFLWALKAIPEIQVCPSFASGFWLKNPEKPFRLVWGSPFWRWSSFVRYTSVARRCEANFIRSSRHISMFQVVSWGEQETNSFKMVSWGVYPIIVT